jgi:hypothetical protein
MAAVKTLALGVLVAGALAPAVRGASLSQGTVQWSLTGGLSSTTTANPILPPGLNAISAQTFSNGGAFTWTPLTTNLIASPPPAPTYAVDAFLDFGNAPYPDANTLTTGGAQPWYTSPSITKLYGGIPSAAQQAQFTAAVVDHVDQTFAQSGIPIAVTTDPNVPAPHTLSVVSNASYPASPGAIGITNVGGNGFSFIDKLKYAGSIDELEWVVAHNVSHELMHAFGGGHHDTTGQYLDAAVSSWSVLANPNTVFSPASVSELRSLNFRDPGATAASGLEQLDPDHGHDAEILAPVPEPATLACWALLAAAVPLARRARRAA